MTDNPKTCNTSSHKRTTTQTTYTYVPILGNIIGYWRETSRETIGETVELLVSTPLSKYDRIYINGVEMKPYDRGQNPL